MKGNIYLRFPSHTEEIDIIHFPGGELGPRIQVGHSHYPEKVEKVEIVARLKSAEDVMTLLLVTDAIRREYVHAEVSAFIPYVPYARQDRVSQRGESLSISVMAGLINDCEFHSVKFLDPHSDETTSRIDYSDVVDQTQIFHGIYPSWGDIYIVAPDKGAAKKSEEFCRRVGAAGVIHCSKIREIGRAHV